jgi:hypothetical protein
MTWPFHAFVPSQHDEGCAYCPFAEDASIHRAPEPNGDELVEQDIQHAKETRSDG